MKKQDSLRALIGLVCVVAIVIGVLVYPPPKEAKALDAEVWLCLDWNNFDNADCAAIATLADASGETIGDFMPLTPNLDFSFWSGTFEDIPVEAVKIKFGWLVGEGGEFSWVDTDTWNNAPTITKAISQPVTQANAKAD